ncbi:MAG: hypothetical protein ACXVLQ_16395 [Bacteriovorax sp.]
MQKDKQVLNLKSIRRLLFIVAPILLSRAIITTSKFVFSYLENDYSFLINKVIKQKEYFEQIDFYGEIEPDVPNLKANNQTLLGIDSNHNGIRDDIDIWINRTAKNDKEAWAMRGYSRELQKALKDCILKKALSGVEKNNLEKLENQLIKIGSMLRDPKDFSVSKLKLMIFNNEDRIQCFKFLSRRSI